MAGQLFYSTQLHKVGEWFQVAKHQFYAKSSQKYILSMGGWGTSKQNFFTLDTIKNMASNIKSSIFEIDYHKCNLIKLTCFPSIFYGYWAKFVNEYMLEKLL